MHAYFRCHIFVPLYQVTLHGDGIANGIDLLNELFVFADIKKQCKIELELEALLFPMATQSFNTETYFQGNFQKQNIKCFKSIAIYVNCNLNMYIRMHVFVFAFFFFIGIENSHSYLYSKTTECIAVCALHNGEFAIACDYSRCHIKTSAYSSSEEFMWLIRGLTFASIGMHFS